MSRGLAFILVLVCLVCLPDWSLAEECLFTCSGEIDCEQDALDCLLRTGQAKQAIQRLKSLIRENPEESGYSRLLARAYLADNNPFWAQRTLQKALVAKPEDCLGRSWLAWVHISQGDLDLARQALDQPGCPVEPVERSRWHLLRAFMARTEKSPEARVHTEQAQESGQLLPEDQDLWLSLRRSENPGFIEPLGMRLELSAGYTNNSKAGSPTDPGTGGTGSLLTRMDLFGRMVLPYSGSARPTLELGLKGHGVAAEEARELSYLEMSARPGVILGGSFPRVLLAYKADYLVLNRDIENRRRFYEGHRGEVELETGNLMAFAGAGRRIFHEAGRTRWEVDGGLGGSLSLGARVRVLLALSLRYYQAVGDPYDLLGGTGLAVARIELGSGYHARLGATLGLDHYHNSGGELGQLAHGTEEKRFDMLGKLSAAVWSASFRGVRFGLSYEYNRRDSSADLPSDNYSYLEHRVLLKTRLAFDLNPWAPDVVQPDRHVALDYGFGSQEGAGMDEERIQDLLRQDEAARRGSSCVD